MTTIYAPTASFVLAADVVVGRLTGQIRHAGSFSPVVGNAAGQVNLAVDRDTTIATGTPLDIDLTAAVDVGNATVNFAKLTHVAFTNRSTVAGEDVTIGGGTNGVFTALPIVVPPGGSIVFAIPLGITIDATHKIFRLTAAAGAAVPGSLTLFGRTA